MVTTKYQKIYTQENKGIKMVHCKKNSNAKENSNVGNYKQKESKDIKTNSKIPKVTPYR